MYLVLLLPYEEEIIALSSVGHIIVNMVHNIMCCIVIQGKKY